MQADSLPSEPPGKPNQLPNVSHSVMSDSLRPHGLYAPLSMGFSRQQYWSGFPFPTPGIFLDQGSNPSLLHYRQILSHQGNPNQLPTSKYKVPPSSFLTLPFTNTIFYDIIADLLDFLSSSLTSSKLYFLPFPVFSEEPYLINLGRVKFVILNISMYITSVMALISLYWNLFACLSLHYTVSKSY